MSSILGGSFRDNIGRVYSRTTSAHEAGRTRHPGRGNFAEVLSDLQQTLEKSKDPANLAGPGSAGGEPVIGRFVPTGQNEVSNLLPEELAQLNANALLSDDEPGAESSESVKSPLGGVKDSTAAALAPQARGAAPSPLNPPLSYDPTDIGGGSPYGIPRFSLGAVEPTVVERSLAPSRPQIVSAKIKETDLVLNTPPKAPVVRGARWLHETSFAGELGIATDHASSRLNRGDIQKIVIAAGRHHGVDPSLTLAVASAESGLRAQAVSNDGHRSKGIFQLLDATGTEMLGKLRLRDRYDPFDPAMNSYLGAGYLRHLHDVFSTETTLTGSLKTRPANSSEQLEKLAVAAYNSGQGTVARAQRKAREMGRDPSRYDQIAEFLPSSTRSYVARVARLKRAFENIA